MRRTLLIGFMIALVLMAGGAAWWLAHREDTSQELTLYGNVDLREVNLAFNNAERIAAVLVQEGDRVRKGQVLAQLDTSRLTPQVEQAQAQAAAQQAVLDRLRHGNRPEEIAQARANVAVAQAEASVAGQKYRRMLALSQSSDGRALSSQDLDDAKYGADQADARLAVSQSALALQLAGARKEDIAQAEAQLHATQAQAALLAQQLADSQLMAPLTAVIRSRLVEPGDMASPQKPAFTLAITNPKWVRAYISEPDLGLVKPGMAATVTVDAFPGQSFRGRSGSFRP